MSRYLIVLAMVVLGVALFWPTLQRLGLGRLPGDIEIKRKSGASFYLPFATCLLLSWLLNALIWLLGR
jgi:Protein of unknown function (DUF2905)